VSAVSPVSRDKCFFEKLDQCPECGAGRDKKKKPAIAIRSLGYALPIVVCRKEGCRCKWDKSAQRSHGRDFARATGRGADVDQSWDREFSDPKVRKARGLAAEVHNDPKLNALDGERLVALARDRGVDLVEFAKAHKDFEFPVIDPRAVFFAADELLDSGYFDQKIFSQKKLSRSEKIVLAVFIVLSRYRGSGEAGMGVCSFQAYWPDGGDKWSLGRTTVSVAMRSLMRRGILVLKKKYERPIFGKKAGSVQMLRVSWSVLGIRPKCAELYDLACLSLTEVGEPVVSVVIEDAESSSSLTPVSQVTWLRFQQVVGAEIFCPEKNCAGPDYWLEGL